MTQPHDENTSHIFTETPLSGTLLSGIDAYYSTIQAAFQDKRTLAYLEIKDARDARDTMAKDIQRLEGQLRKSSPSLLPTLQSLVEKASHNQPEKPSIVNTESLRELCIDLALIHSGADGLSTLSLPFQKATIEYSATGRPENLQTEIDAHVRKAVQSCDPGYKQHPHALIRGGQELVGYRFNDGDLAKLAREIRKVPEALDQLKIKLDVVDIQFRRYDESAAAPAQRRVYIQLNPCAINYRLVPVRVGMKPIFPGYQVPFTLETALGPGQVWMTSRAEGSRKKGNYVVGNLAPVYEHLNAGPNDFLILDLVEHQRTMRLVGITPSVPANVPEKDISYNNNTRPR